MENLTEAEKLAANFRTKHQSALERIAKLGDVLRDTCDRIQDSWSGSFAGWHGRMYFHDFQTPTVHEQFNGEWGGIHGIPDGWEERRTEEVEAKINELVGNGFDVRAFEDELPKIRKEAEKMRDDVAIHLSAYPFGGATQKVKELAEKLESFKFGDTKTAFIQRGLPKGLMSRDSEAIRQGMCIPSWLYYRGVALEATHLSEEVDKYISSVERLKKQVEIQAPQAVRDQSSQVGGALTGLHAKINDKCHSLYEKGEYAEAVEKGFKVVRDRLRELTGHETGSEAFGKTKLHIKGAAASNVDDDFNQGVKFLTMAIDRFRNEKSHTSDAKIDDPVRAYEYLRLSSLAMNLLDNSEILS